MVEMTEQDHANYTSCFLHVLCILIIPSLLCIYVGYCTVAINFAQATIWVIEEQT